MIIFSSPTVRPVSSFYPDEETVLIRIADHEGLLLRHDDRIEDYGEPGAGCCDDSIRAQALVSWVRLLAYHGRAW